MSRRVILVKEEKEGEEEEEEEEKEAEEKSYQIPIKWDSKPVTIHQISRSQRGRYPKRP